MKDLPSSPRTYLTGVALKDIVTAPYSYIGPRSSTTVLVDSARGHRLRSTRGRTPSTTKYVSGTSTVVSGRPPEMETSLTPILLYLVHGGGRRGQGFRSRRGTETKIRPPLELRLQVEQLHEPACVGESLLLLNLMERSSHSNLKDHDTTDKNRDNVRAKYPDPS